MQMTDKKIFRLFAQRFRAVVGCNNTRVNIKLDILPFLKEGDSYGVSGKRSLRRVPGLSTFTALLISPEALLSGYPPVVQLRKLIMMWINGKVKKKDAIASALSFPALKGEVCRASIKEREDVYK